MPWIAWCLCSWLGAAWAHPFSDTMFGHQLSVRLTGDVIAVSYQAEVPTRILLAELREGESKAAAGQTIADVVAQLPTERPAS